MSGKKILLLLGLLLVGAYQFDGVKKILKCFRVSTVLLAYDSCMFDSSCKSTKRDGLLEVKGRLEELRESKRQYCGD